MSERIQTSKSTEGIANKETAVRLIQDLEEHRIQPGTEFAELYSEYPNDVARAERQRESYEREAKDVQLGKAGEALVYSLMNEGEVGKHFSIRPTATFDDIFKGTDLLIEMKRSQSAPALAAVDVTINQKDIKGEGRANTEAQEERPVGLDAKLARIRRHIDHIASMDADRARHLAAWLQSGGLHEQKTAKNQREFDESDRVILVKYYKAPGDAPEPDKPMYITHGPKTVISIDTEFVNRALAGNEKAKEQIQALSFLEFAYGISALHTYLDEKIKSSPKGMNLFFDNYYAATKAWVNYLSKPEVENLIQELGKCHITDPTFKKQLSYYSQTLTRAFMPIPPRKVGV